MQSSSIKDQVSQKHSLGVFLDYFFVEHTVRQTDKICRTFPKFGSFVRQTGGFREDRSISGTDAVEIAVGVLPLDLHFTHKSEGLDGGSKKSLIVKIFAP